MAELIALFTLVALSLLAVRFGTIALEKTGLSREAAAFQAQSAFMGVGFTTSESETVVNHAVRRRIVRLLMLLGFGAVTSTLGTVVLTFARHGDSTLSPLSKAAILALGIAALAVVVRQRWIHGLVDRVIARAIERTGALRVIDFHELLDLDKGYTVATLGVHGGSWLEGRSLRELCLADEGVLVLNVRRDNGVVIATPASGTRLHTDDTVLAYGLEADLEDLRRRPAGADGDEAHERGLARQRVRLAGERTEDAAAEREQAGTARHGTDEPRPGAGGDAG